IGFRFKDWSDYIIEKEEIAIADGETRSFKIIKNYNNQKAKITRRISKPVKDTVKVYIDNILEAPLIVYSTGIIFFKDAPKKGSKISVEAEFDVPVRFDIDRLVTSIENYGVYSHQEIPLLEIKL
ncbi:MAG: DUF2460 domain-containing protein, partial [Pseudomonadota bacterium]